MSHATDGSMPPVPAPHIPIRRMRQQVTVVDRDDDWTGVVNQAARRRLQNRLNQRAYRIRQRENGSSEESSNRREKKSSSGHQTLQSLDSGSSRRTHTNERPSTTYPVQFSNLDLRTEQHSNTNQAVSSELSNGTTSNEWFKERSTLLAQFHRLGFSRYIASSPTSDHLLCLMQFNVMRAIEMLTITLGLTPDDMMNDDCMSPFSCADPGCSSLVMQNTSGEMSSMTRFPVSLFPTALQRMVPHHPWIDMLPFPRMRDNLLLSFCITSSDQDRSPPACLSPYMCPCDEDEFCHYVCGLDPDQKESGLIVWGEPWDASAWEVTPGFVKRWGWTLHECWDLFKSTNHWRATRGEKPLFSVSLYGMP